MTTPEWIQSSFASLRVARRFAGELRPEIGRIVQLALVSLAAVAFDLLRPWPIQWIVDHALAPGEAQAPLALTPRQVILSGALATALLVLAKSLAQYWREVGLGQTELQLTRRLRYKLFSHLTLLSPGFHARNKSGDLLVRVMGDVPMVSGMLVSSYLEVGTRLVLVAGTVAIMLVVDPILTAATFALSPIVLVLVHTISKRIHSAVRKQRGKEGELADYLHEAISATETIQSLGAGDEVVRRFARNNRSTARAGLRAKRLAAKMSGSVESLLGAGLAIVLALGSSRVLDGVLSTGELLVFRSYVRTLAKPIRSASKHTAKIAKGTACGERLLEIVSEAPEVVEYPGAVEAPPRPARLVFESVDYRYPGPSEAQGQPALHGFSASFEQGRLSALVGRSGAGKSTAAALAARLFDPDSGRILLGDQPLIECTLESVRQCVGLCLQRTMLFGESIRENLLLGTPEADESELWRVLRLAGADDFVRGLEQGLDTRLGSGGVGLSGGQLSRLSLARTLLRDVGVLIVDEPFAGLDREATLRLARTLTELATEKIVIAIAHDFENLDQYDKVVFLESGAALDEGTHAELSERRPDYRAVVRSHSS